MSRFKDSCRDCTIFPARLKVSCCPYDLRGLQRVMGERVLLEEPVRVARGSGRDRWPVGAAARLGVRGCTAVS
jgi:hypothetical protein